MAGSKNRDTTVVSWTVGKLLGWQVRSLLNKAKSSGYNIAWQERSTWLTNPFVIEGDSADVAVVSGIIERG